MVTTNTVFWDVTRCSSEPAWRFGGTYSLHLQGPRVKPKLETRGSRPSFPYSSTLNMQQYVHPKRRPLSPSCTALHNPYALAFQYLSNIKLIWRKIHTKIKVNFATRSVAATPCVLQACLCASLSNKTYSDPRHGSQRPFHPCVGGTPCSCTCGSHVYQSLNFTEHNRPADYRLFSSKSRFGTDKELWHGSYGTACVRARLMAECVNSTCSASVLIFFFQYHT
jgi:hypothetical protein